MTHAIPRKRFVVGIDFTPGSEALLDRALELGAEDHATEMHVVHVAEETSIPLPLPVPRNLDAELERLMTLVQERVRRRALTQGVEGIHKIMSHVLIGAPADEIVWLAASVDADLIIVATHGRKGLKRLLMGSVAERVLRLAGCPVLVMRDKEHSAEWRVPEIEPLCDDCAQIRLQTHGQQAWCARHSEHHVFGHAFFVGHSGGPAAYSSSSGT